MSSKQAEPTLRWAATEGARLVREGRINAKVAELLKVLVHSAKKTLEFRDAQLAKAAARRKK